MIEKETGPKTETAEFLVGRAATTDFNGEDAYVICDNAEPAQKYYTSKEDIFKAAKAAQTEKKKLAIKWIEKPSDKRVVRWITALA